MAIDYGIVIHLDASLSQKQRASIVRRTIQVLEPQIDSIVYNTEITTDPASLNQVSLWVGGTNRAFSIRVIMDTAVVGLDKVPGILRKIIQGLEGELERSTYSESYAEGTAVSNLVITLS